MTRELNKSPVKLRPQSPLAQPRDSAAWAATVERLGLSPQQARIIERIVGGMNDKQIALDLNIGVPTVRTYLTRAFERVGVRGRMPLAMRVLGEYDAQRCPQK